MEEIVTTVASEAAEPLLALVRRQCGYVIFTNSYVGQLEEELEKLNYARERVQHSVNEARSNRKLIEGDVMKWVKDAETVANKARDVLDDDGRAKKTCFYGWLSNPKARYCLGRDARKTAQAIQPLIPQSNFERVYHERAPPGLVGSVPDVNLSAGDGGDTIQEPIARGQFENPPPGLVGGAPNVNSSACDGGDTIQELTARGQFKKVDFENPQTVLVGGASGVNSSAGEGGDFITGSRASIFQDIMKALNDEKLKVIGVYGPGGVGKTTLLKEVEKKLREAGRPFRMIVKVRVSKIPDLNNIRDQIADALRLDLKDKQSPEGKADALSERLKSNPNEKVLIIFDNLWVNLELEAVGVPWGDVSGKCKLLLTSRFKNVVEQQMGADQTFLLQGLTDGEAFKLFENEVGDKLKDNEELKSIADQVVKKLAGLPLLINSVASTLKSSNEYAWRNALIELDDSNKKKKETIVKLSYGHLKNEDAKYLFLLCGLIGGTIPVELLLVLAMGLGLFQRFNKTMPDLRDRLNNMLDELRSACLLLEGGDDKDNVTIHDLYSEVVVSTPFQDQNSLMMNNNYGASSKEELEKCWAICLDDAGLDRLAKLMPCQFPSLKILMLSTPKDWDRKQKYSQYTFYVRDYSDLSDFKDMKELRVLYLRFMDITNLPRSIEILENLRSLYLYNCNVEDVAIIGKLKALQSLSFTGSTISRLPEEIGELTNLRLLNLSDCRKLRRIEPAILERLIKLEELHMKGSFDRWMGKNEKPSELCNVGLAELRSMTKLNSLEISIRDPIILLEVDNLPFEDLTRFWINIGNFYEGEFKCLRTMFIKLEGHDSILSQKWVQKTLQKTQYLCLDGLGEFENAYELCIQGFPQLKHLDIKNSPSVKYIASSSNSAFAILESLFLCNLNNLERICHGHITAKCFSKLKAVRVNECNQLEYLWSLSQMQNLVQLEEINVWTCNSMRAIARKDTLPANCRVELPYLRHLHLGDLPNMRSFCPRAKMTSEGTPIQAGVVDEGGGDEGTDLVTTTSDLQNTYSDSFFERKASLPNLEELHLYSVGSFKRIWHDELSKSSFCKLATIIVAGCSDLLHILPLTIIGRLHNLKSVEVYNCQSLKTLFDCGSLDSNMEQTTVLIPKLVSIDIKSCPSLESLFNCGSLDSNVEDLKLDSIGSFKRIWHDKISKSFLCKLATITVENCSNLLHIFPSTVISRLHNLKSVEVYNCPSLKVLFDCGSLDSNTEQTMVLLPELVSIDIESCLSLESLFNFGSLDSNLEDLKLDSVGSFKRIGHDELSRSSFCKLAAITVEKCSNLLHIFPSTIIRRLHNLKSVKVNNCRSLKTLFDCGSLDSNMEQTTVLLPELVSIDIESCLSLELLFNCGSLDSNVEDLKLDSVGSFKRIGHDELSRSSFCKLATITVENCSNLLHIFPSTIIRRLHNLKSVKVNNCRSLKTLFDCGSLDSNTEQTMVLLPELVSIDIESCLSLESLFNCGSLGSNAEHKIILLPKLGEVSVSGAKKLRHLVMSHSQTDHSQIVLGFPSLETVYVENCFDLRYLFPKYTATTLEKLKRLKITKCEQMKEVILEKEAGRSEAKVMSFPCLSELILKELNNLIRFGSGSVKRQLGETAEENDESPQPLFNEMVTFPNMRNLEIEGVPCKELWNNHVPTDSIVCSHRFLSKNVKVKNCPSLKSLFDLGSLDSNTEQNVVLLPELVSINVESCPSLESLFNCGSLDSNAEHKIILLPKLEEVSVSGAKKLRHVFMSHSQIVLGFPSLETVRVENCSDLRYLFPKYTAKNVRVKNCASLKSLFDFGSLDSNTEQNVVLLPELVSIDIESCPSLESLFNCGSLDSNAEHKIILLPKLEEVRLSGAKKLRHVVMSHFQIVLGFPSLKTVHVKNCFDLRYLFPKYTATTLKKLEWLQITKCEQMKEVILEKEVGRSEAEVMSFPCLSKLTLKELNNLISFSSISVKRQLGETTEENDTLSQPLFNEMVTFPNMRYLEIEGVPCKKLWNNHVPADSIVCSHQFLLEDVKVKNCPSLKSLFDFRSLDSNTEQNAILLPELVSINVESCPSLESLFNCGSLDSNAEHKIILLPKLEKVSVSGAKKLRHVVMSHSQIVLGFPSLEIVRVENCSDLRYLFPKYTTTTLEKLEWLEITKCEQMNEVILEKEASRLEAEVMSFPCLSKLTLKELDNLISFSLGSVQRQLGETAKENDESPQPLFNEMVTFPNITSLEIKGLHCKDLWNNQIPIDSFQKLESLVLENCDNLQRIATSYMWKKLQCCLEKLKVISCHSVEIIYEGDGIDTESGKLRRLVLCDLKNLRCIWQSNSLPNIPFPNLRDVEAVRCPRLEMLFPTFTAKFLGQIKKLVVESCEDMEQIVGHEKWEEVTGTAITFSMLNNLKLFKLPKFKSFLPEKYSLKFSRSKDFPSLEVLSIGSCGVESDQDFDYWEDYELT